MLKTTRGLTTLAFACVGLAAQTPTQAPSDDINDLLTLLNTPVVSASKHAERTIEAPSVVSLAVRDQVGAYGWTSLNDLLFTLPGFSASQDYDRSTVSSRGLFEGWNNNHLLMLVDGIPFNDNLYGSAYTWEISPVFMANTVEVVRGPGSALYGSNAMSGVIQMKTVSAKDLPGGGAAQIRVGQDGLRIYDFVTGRRGDLISSVVGFSANQSNGNNYWDYDGSARTDPAGRLAKFFVNDDRNSRYAWAKLEGEGTLKGLSLQYHLQDWSFKTGHGWLWEIPDLGEGMQERRQIASLSYTGDIGSDWHQEYLLRHQVHDINWNTRYYPNGEFVDPDTPGSGYPNGVFEYLDTSANDDFLRTQWSLDLPRSASFLFGFEGDRFLYTGDRSHYANINMGTFAANPGNAQLPLQPWLAWIMDRPILNTGLYAQFDSGKLFGKLFKAVLGLRSDRTSFDYNVLNAAQGPSGSQESKSFSNTSPRLALVIMPSEDLAIKIMGGKAFRSPAPSELAGSNTLSLSSNIRDLKPETLTTYEFAVDWIVNPHMNWRTNLFWTKFNNEIAYSASNLNLSTNVYTLTTEGLESELLYGVGAWRGFLNFSYAKRVNETILDTTIAPSSGLTWVPARMIKCGVIYDSGPFKGSLSGTYSGRVDRRSTDVGSEAIPLQGTVIDMDQYRSTSVSPWWTLNSKLTYEVTHTFSVSLAATNLLNKQYYLAKTLAFPFDYRGSERNVSVILKAAF